MIECPPNRVNFRWRQIIKGIDDRWQKVTAKWPDPWHRWEGVLDEGDGAIFAGPDTEIPAHYRIWYHAAATMSDVSGWGGTAELTDIAPYIDAGDEYTLRLQNRDTGTILVSRVNRSSNRGATIAFSGQRAFPSSDGSGI